MGFKPTHIPKLVPASKATKMMFKNRVIVISMRSRLSRCQFRDAIACRAMLAGIQKNVPSVMYKRAAPYVLK